MGISVNTDTTKDKPLSVVKDIGAATAAIGAGATTYGIAEILSAGAAKKTLNNIINEALVNNNLFKDASKQAFTNENIFCTTIKEVESETAKVLYRIVLEPFDINTAETKLKPLLDNKYYKIHKLLSSKNTDLASRINDKIDKLLAKIVSPVTNMISKLEIKKGGDLIEQTEKGLNAMTKKDVVFCDLEKLSVTSFHEMGHVKNYMSKGIGKVLQAMRHPLVKKIAIATALLGVLLPPTKKDDGNNNSVLGKTGNFIKDNCVAISALATVPMVLEEGLASIKGAQIAKKVLTPDKLKMVNKLNGKALLTYIAGAVLIPLGIYAAKKTREALA